MHRVVAALGQGGAQVVHLAAQQVEALLQFIQGHREEEFHGQHGRAVVALCLNLLHVGQGAQGVFHLQGHVQFHLVGAGAGIGHHHHGLLYGHGGVFQLGHLDESDDARHNDTRHQ